MAILRKHVPRATISCYTPNQHSVFSLKLLHRALRKVLQRSTFCHILPHYLVHCHTSHYLLTIIGDANCLQWIDMHHEYQLYLIVLWCLAKIWSPNLRIRQLRFTKNLIDDFGVVVCMMFIVDMTYRPYRMRYTSFLGHIRYYSLPIILSLDGCSGSLTISSSSADLICSPLNSQI